MARKKNIETLDDDKPVAENAAGLQSLPVHYVLTENFSFKWKAEYGLVKTISYKAGQEFVDPKLIEILKSFNAPLKIKE